MGKTVITDTKNTVFAGCDFVVQVPDKNAKILQLTDMQIIDSLQRRTPDRLRPDEIAAWTPDAFDSLCGNHVRSLVAQADPDLIIITGDIVYGSFDDAGTTFRYMCDLLDSFEIPWAPVFGNHDNESARGVAWQCEQFANCRHCLFKRGNVTGNGNYTVGVAVGDELIRVIHMLDSNGCYNDVDPAVVRQAGIYGDQLEMIAENTASVCKAQSKNVPAFVAFHIPIEPFKQAEYAKDYRTEDDDRFILGVDRVAKDGDFGFCLEKYHTLSIGENGVAFLKEQNVDGVFAGHVHNACTCISHQGIRWVFGLKTGQYDYHIPYQLGGTLITLDGDTFDVRHMPSLAPCGAMPAAAPMFKGLFETGK